MSRVWRLKVVNEPRNHFGIDLSQTWKAELLPDVYDTVELAERAILDKTRSDPETCGIVGPYLIQFKSDKQKNEFLRAFCFTDDLYLPYRRFFLRKPDKYLVHQMCIRAAIRFVSLTSRT